jgi:serine/threonine protein kinase/tetratricopeptide (TPR) repeat protein
MAEPFSQEEAIFYAALEIDAADQRAAYLDEACGDQRELRRRVEALLRRYAESAGPLDRPVGGPGATTAEPPAERPGVIIGPYKLLEQIGEGGMGSVWMAQQTAPVKRLVALKLIKAGMDSKQVLARFEAERQALALMDHPHIARVLDGGTTGAGRPYFVMDLVKGVPITKYCDEHHLTPRQRLELFLPVCQAVQHAHQKGVIHRDLKPSNVLVALYDGQPVPKIIDFGVAKAAGPTLTDKTLVTGFGTVVGTPEYMSPEQAELNQLDIDTRSDVYSLGVLLYELLTGSPPFGRKGLEQGGLLEMLRVIREQEPTRPSAKLSTAEGLPTLAANRGTEPAKLTRLVRGELDWIVMKCLEKDRNRRYQTANSFALDLQRYLADEPVLACPPSVSYRLGKLLRRNKGAVLAAGLVLLALLAGMVGTSIGLLRAENRRAEAEQARSAEAERAQGEHLANLEVQKQLARVLKSNDILASIFDDLDIRQVNKGTEPLEAVLAQRLIQAAAQLEGDAVGDPLLVADLQDRLGLTLHRLGHHREAIGLFVKARDTHNAHLGADHPATLTSMNNLANGYQAVGDLALALPLYEDTLKRRKKRLGADHSATLTSMNNLANGYKAVGKLHLTLPLYVDTLKLRKERLGDDHPDTLQSMNNLAAGYRAAGKLALALPLYEEALRLRKVRLGPHHPDTLQSMNNLALGYLAGRELHRALPLLEETLELRKAKLGARHPDTLTSMNNLAGGYKTAGKLHLALPLYVDTLKLQKAKLGDDHPDTLQSMNNLALGYLANKELHRALPLLEETLELRKTKLGANHPDTLTSVHNLATGYLTAHKADPVLALLREAAEGVERLGFRHEHAEQMVNDLITHLENLQQFDQAEGWRRKWVAVVKERTGADSLIYASPLAGLGSNLMLQKKWAEAEAVLRESLAILLKKQPDGWPRFSTESLLGAVLLGQGRYADAEPLLLQGYKGLKQRAATIPPQFRQPRITAALTRLVRLYDGWHRMSEAAKWRKELEALTKASDKVVPSKEK